MSEAAKNNTLYLVTGAAGFLGGTILVYCSSTGAIPELPKGQAIREVDRFNANVVEGCYSQSKALASQIVLDAANHLGLNACIVHPSGIMGPEDYAVGETRNNVFGEPIKKIPILLTPISKMGIFLILERLYGLLFMPSGACRKGAGVLKTRIRASEGTEPRRRSRQRED